MILLLCYVIHHLWLLGSAVAVVVSYSEHKSPFRAALAGLFGWFYVLLKW